MMTINKQDVIKTALIIWFLSATVYVIYDLYTDFKVRGIQAAYQQGYTNSIDDLIKRSQEGKCQQPVEIKKDDVDLKLIDVQCLQKPEATPATPQAGQKK